MPTLSNKAWIVLLIFVLIFGVVVGYSFGKSIGFQAGQEMLKSEVNKAKEDVLNLQKELENIQIKAF